MNVLLLAVALMLSVLLAAGWVLLLSTLLVTLSAATVGGVVEGAAYARRFAPALSRETVRGILCIDGLVSEPTLARRLRSDIARVLNLAAPDTRPRACACVKESGGAFIGVLRIFNTKGHYLLRASADSAAAVVRQFSAALHGSASVFPARVGARREECPECNPMTCPLRGRKREPVLATV